MTIYEALSLLIQSNVAIIAAITLIVSIIVITKRK